MRLHTKKELEARLRQDPREFAIKARQAHLWNEIGRFQGAKKAAEAWLD